MRHRDCEKEQRIRDAVIQVVLDEGFSGASISKIAKRAGISQATVYVYYENKEAMLRAIYLECEEALYDFLFAQLDGARTPEEKLERLIRGYYAFILENNQQFSFVEQFSSCPVLVHDCAAVPGFVRMLELLERWKADGVLLPYQTVNLFALLFHPVKMLAAGASAYQADGETPLAELIQIIQTALLTKA